MAAIRAGVNPGLTMVVGPPGTGKTDVAVQIMHELYHNRPQERTLLITHSNHALNDLFQKIMERDIPARYLLRLGMGEQARPPSPPPPGPHGKSHSNGSALVALRSLSAHGPQSTFPPAHTHEPRLRLCCAPHLERVGGLRRRPRPGVAVDALGEGASPPRAETPPSPRGGAPRRRPLKPRSPARGTRGVAGRNRSWTRTSTSRARAA